MTLDQWTAPKKEKDEWRHFGFYVKVREDQIDAIEDLVEQLEKKIDPECLCVFRKLEDYWDLYYQLGEIY